MKKLILTSVLAAFSIIAASAQQTTGGISPEMLEQISSTYEDNAYDKAISNAEVIYRGLGRVRSIAETQDSKKDSAYPSAT